VPPAPAETDIFIQVRRGSRRLPDKALADLGGEPCLSQVVRRCARVQRARHVVVCTSTQPEDGVLAELATSLGVRAFRGELENCLDRFLSCAGRFGSKVVVRITGDSPLVDPGTIDQAVDHLAGRGLDYVRVAGLPVGAHVEAFTTEALERTAAAAVQPSPSDDLTLFIGSPEINHVGEVPAPARLRRPDLVLALNRPEDLHVLQAVFDRVVPASTYVTLEEAIRFLDANPEVAAANRPYVPAPTHCNTALDPERLARARQGGQARG
jgi:spore coat polysaccharide biosynthesis protein SpsF (cytidylyltransferase family)